ncbi:LGFP repeat-containing protein [Nonomuraea sp. NPDC059007]|uniref:LGFP repeat-containing protein n=1 Tax=Nonomuraea sp. NPDC059007 TaxID=3346692 RepID=UPI00367A89B1
MGAVACLQRSTAAYVVVVALLPSPVAAVEDAEREASIAACNSALVAPPGSLVGDYWRSKGGERSIYGCPTTRETGFPDKRGSIQRFKNGQIAWSPNMGGGNLLRVYQKN